MKEKLTKQEVAEAKKEAKAFGQMKKKFKHALLNEIEKKHGDEAKKFMKSKIEVL
jgi:hypothetical protein